MTRLLLPMLAVAATVLLIAVVIVESVLGLSERD